MGRRIQKAMDVAGETPATIAPKLEVSRVAVVQWRSGTNNPRLKHLLKLAALCGVTLDSLVA
mgnify:CR=1 FL=1